MKRADKINDQPWEVFAMYLFAQIIGFCATAILLTYTLCTVSRKTIMICNVIIHALWAVHYLILDAYTGAFCSFFTAFMVLVCSFKGKNAFFRGPWVPILFNISFIIIEIFTWAGFSTLIQMAGNILLVIAMWSDREISIKALFIPVGILWFIYNFIFFSWIGLICQALAVSFNVIYVTRYVLRKRKASLVDRADKKA